MGYGIRSKSSYKAFDCSSGAWPKYFALGTAFGWVPAGAVFPSNYGVVPTFESYFSNDWQEVTDHDALAFGAALELAIAAIKTESPMTDRQEAALKKFEFSDDPHANAPPEIRAYIAKLEQSLPEYHPVVRTIQSQRGSFNIDIQGIMDLAEVVSAGGFFIA